MSEYTDGRGVTHLSEKSRDSLRDDFAGRALSGLVARRTVLLAEDYAEEAYDIADAMLKERERHGYD